MMSQSKICAVVVTYNRLELLKLCVESLKKQTRSLDEILIINNSSTDGTAEWLEKQNDLVFVTQENTGGAGGFHTGIKTAYEKGFDWIWCMDDDCLPEDNSLNLLSKYLDKTYKVLNCLVYSSSGDLLNGLYDNINKTYYTTSSQLANIEIIEGARFFNGTLISSVLIKEVGYPYIDFYVLGDEIEYQERIKSTGNRIGTVCKSVIYHPEQKNIIIQTLFFRYLYEFFEKEKRYYQARNSVYIIKKYPTRSWITFLKTLFLDLFCIVFIHKNKEVLKNYVKGIVDGVTFIPKK